MRRIRVGSCDVVIEDLRRTVLKEKMREKKGHPCRQGQSQLHLTQQNGNKCGPDTRRICAKCVRTSLLQAAVIRHCLPLDMRPSESIRSLFVSRSAFETVETAVETTYSQVLNCMHVGLHKNPPYFIPIHTLLTDHPSSAFPSRPVPPLVRDCSLPSYTLTRRLPLSLLLTTPLYNAHPRALSGTNPHLTLCELSRREKGLGKVLLQLKHATGELAKLFLGMIKLVAEVSAWR